jgi:hypothetical protein
VEDVAAELRAVQPDGEWVALGRHQVYRFRIETPAHTFESVVADAGAGRLVQLTARDSFDERLAVFLLDQVLGAELPGPRSRTIRVAEAAFPGPWRFEAVVVAPPPVARRFEGQSAALQRATYWAVPAFAGEFADRAGGAAFWHQLGRKDGWRSVVVRWDRPRKTRPVFDA